MHTLTYRQLIGFGPRFYLCVFCALIICFFSTVRPSAAAQDYEIQVDFYFDADAVSGKQVDGYLLYMENEPVCEIGSTGQQSFTCIVTAETGAYNFSISALYDDNSESPQSASFPFNLLSTTEDPGGTPEEEVAFYFELAEIQLNQNWTHFTFNKPFVDPVIIAGPPSSMAAEPVTVRVRNVTQTGFEIRLQEWDYLDGNHGLETLSYIVMEKGIYTLENGAKIEAGTVTSKSTKFRNGKMQQKYDQAPILLTQVMTENETDAVTVRVRNIKNKKFKYSLQEQEGNKKRHARETIGYIAWEPGYGETSGLFYEAGFVAQGVDDRSTGLDFQTALPESPLFFAAIQTRSDRDTAALRTQSISQTTAWLSIEEEQSKNEEVEHREEVVGYLALGDATAAMSY